MSTVANIEPLLRVNDVTALLGISRTTLWEMERRGEITPVRIGKSVRFRPAEVRRIIGESDSQGTLAA